MWIFHIPNDCSATGNPPFLVWGGVRATTGAGELWPRNYRLLCCVQNELGMQAHCAGGQSGRHHHSVVGLCSWVFSSLPCFCPACPALTWNEDTHARRGAVWICWSIISEELLEVGGWVAATHVKSAISTQTSLKIGTYSYTLQMAVEHLSSAKNIFTHHARSNLGITESSPKQTFHFQLQIAAAITLLIWPFIWSVKAIQYMLQTTRSGLYITGFSTYRWGTLVLLV